MNADERGSKREREERVAAGKAIVDYVFNRVIVSAILFILVDAGVDWTRNYFGEGVDSSDRDGFQRSGLQVRTDYQTGVEFLESRGGGLVVRVKGDADQIKELR